MVTLDHALPVTSLQIWLADGRRLVQRFNLSHRCVSKCRGLNTSLHIWARLTSCNSAPAMPSVNPIISSMAERETVKGMTKDFWWLYMGWGVGLFEDYVMLCSSLLELKAWCMLAPLPQCMGLQKNIIWDVARSGSIKSPERDCVTRMHHLYNRVCSLTIERAEPL